jgi:4-amino-4-deoxy-L-arabinose transferase-like glycosyltransferase
MTGPLLALLAVITLILSCIGYGNLVCRLCGAARTFESPRERGIIDFIVGLGVLGWILFFPGVLGYYSPLIFWAVCLPGAGRTAVLLARSRISFRLPGLSKLHIVIAALVLVVVTIDIFEGISPPADADTLAYHFALPADFIAAGQVSFVPRAVSGAIPLLMHMTYASAYSMGGEVALTLWVMVTGWAASVVVFAFIRRHVSRSWALTAALIFLTTPAVLYGSGNGQVEIRSALFVVAAVVFMISRQQNGTAGQFVLGGLCAGFFVATKYYGLIFLGAAGLVILFQRGGLRNGLVFGMAALLAGFQWYLWNWIHTGDPVFPTLTNLLQYPDSSIWTQEFGRYFSEILASGELPLDRTLFNWLSYPVLSTFNLAERLEGGRTGLGIISILILPLAIYGLSRSEYRRREFVVPLAIALIFFTVWFFSGTTQRTRHLLPVYPLILICLFPVVVDVARRMSLSFPLVAGLSAVVVIQIAGQFVFGVNYITHIFSPETRSAFYQRNVPSANAALWAASELPDESKLGFTNRQLAYLLPIPSYMIHPHLQVLIDGRASVKNEGVFVAQIKRQGITHLLLPGDWGRKEAQSADRSNFSRLVERLIQQGCLKPLREFDTFSISSRTLRSFGAEDIKNKETLFELEPGRCPK